MSTRRLLATVAGMALTAGALAELTPGLGAMAGSLAAAQRTADTAGSDALVLAGAGLAAWAVWGWAALGLALTAASALPGLAGGVARSALQVALPAGARRGAAVALGIGIGVAGPLGATTAMAGPTPATATAEAAASSEEPVPDWPARTPEPAPDWPRTSPPTGTRLVVRGDCLWHIASDRLSATHGRAPTDGEVAAATAAWWHANAAVIGPDPDLLLPGQVLVPPDPP